MPVSSFWGRAPVLFWTSVIGLGTSIGTSLAPTYEVYFAMRVLTALFLTSGQTMSIAVLKDIFFFHERARKLGLWSVIYIASPYLGPCFGDFIIYETENWPDVFWLCVGVVGLQIVLVICFIDETWYNREKSENEQPFRPVGFAGRLSRLIGVWQIQHHKDYFPNTWVTIKKFALLITRPAFFLICLS